MIVVHYHDLFDHLAVVLVKRLRHECDGELIQLSCPSIKDQSANFSYSIQGQRLEVYKLENTHRPPCISLSQRVAQFSEMSWDEGIVFPDITMNKKIYGKHLK